MSATASRGDSGRVRVGVDCHSVSGLHQGIRTHVLELFGRAVTLAPDIDFFLLAEEPEALARFSAAFRAPNAALIPLRHSGPVRRLLVELPRLARRHRLDLLHCQYIAPPLAPCRTAVTIHDLLFETAPRFFTRWFTLRSRILMRLSAARATLVCTVSEFSRGELVRLYGLAPRDVLVVANAADRGRFHPGADGQEVVRRRGLTPGAYLLSVGRLEPRKNQATLLRAYARLPRDAPPLVIVGQRHFGYGEVAELAASAALAGRVHLLEDVVDQELPAWYRNALGFVYPSWAEGFGMPVIEAFASGVPVICSDTTALTEVAAGAAVLVPPDDVAGLADAMSALVLAGERRMELAERGLERARAYDWDASAAALVARYREVLRDGVERR